MSDAKKCANPACSCIPPNHEKFCSSHCEGLDDSVEIVCQCGHDHCALGSTRTVPVATVTVMTNPDPILEVGTGPTETVL
jgi:hypothetical protein